MNTGKPYNGRINQAKRRSYEKHYYDFIGSNIKNVIRNNTSDIINSMLSETSDKITS